MKKNMLSDKLSVLVLIVGIIFILVSVLCKAGKGFFYAALVCLLLYLVIEFLKRRPKKQGRHAKPNPHLPPSDEEN